MNREAKKEQSDLHITPLEDEKTQQSLRDLLQVFLTSFGSHGKIKALHNNVGGHVTFTSSSGRIIQQLSVDNPLCRLVTTSVQGHLSSYPDGGLFAATLCLLVVRNSHSLTIHRHLLIDIYETILIECMSILNSPSFPAKSKISFSSVYMLQNFVKTIVKSKAISCVLTVKDCDFLSNLFLEAFLQTFPKNDDRGFNFGTIQYLTVEGKSTRESHILNGILFEAPQIPVYRNTPLNLIKCTEGPHKGQICTAVFSVSLAGDCDEFVDATYEVEDIKTFNNVVVDQMEEMSKCLIKLQVSVVACQKVIHPKIKKSLREAGVLTIDRLGLKYIEAVQNITGTVVIFH